MFVEDAGSDHMDVGYSGWPHDCLIGSREHLLLFAPYCCFSDLCAFVGCVCVCCIIKFYRVLYVYTISLQSSPKKVKLKTGG